ncbi:Der GTPase-activating protein YihI [Ningiella sp. W23]|uniref:Der GTPase-activating protein YihI n=1 Tax=Ningiella sp. W23 TaxID=3023715 RepID=UPI0037563296
MAHSKKSRKVGKIGVSKSDKPMRKPRALDDQSHKSKKKSGNKAGTRQQLNDNASSSRQNKDKSDPRLGSTKAINLNKYKHSEKKPVKSATKYVSPKQELDALESSPELEILLEKQENGKLDEQESKRLHLMIARHKELCDMLGIEADDVRDDSDTTKNVQSDDDVDPFAQLDAIKLDDFKD